MPLVIGGGNKLMPVVIEIGNIDEVQATIKNGKVMLQFEANFKAGDIDRLFNLSKQGVFMQAIIYSHQATMDLKFDEVNTNTGELTPKPKRQ